MCSRGRLDLATLRKQADTLLAYSKPNVDLTDIHAAGHSIRALCGELESERKTASALMTHAMDLDLELREARRESRED